jgi:formylglycine-generating enzyme required for sulfatase activity
MHGNVSEWCSDRLGGDYSGDTTDPQGPASGEYRVFRSGGWRNNAQDCRSSYRSGNKPSDTYRSVGFRVALRP